MRVAVDVMGGDHGPQVVIDGVKLALQANSNVAEAILVGDEAQIKAALQRAGCRDSRLRVVHATQVLTMEDDPRNAVRKKKDCSMARAIDLLNEGAADAVISLGNTGGLVTILMAIFFFGTKGRGTPAPFDPPVQLVIRGPHRYVRNPMYAGVVVTTLGWALVFRSWDLVLYAGLAWVAFHLFVMLVEEPGLRRRFGSAYAEYCLAVHRWVPGHGYRR